MKKNKTEYRGGKERGGDSRRVKEVDNGRRRRKKVENIL